MLTPLYTPELARNHSPENPNPYETVLDYLTSPELATDAALGRVTLALIKPSLDTAMLGEEPMSDLEAADVVEREIALGMGLKFSVSLDLDTVEEFYGGEPKHNSMLPSPPLTNPAYPTRWEEFVDLMISGPLTVLILRDEEGNAIDRWRSQLGHWNVEARRDPSTIRGRHAKDNHNNLLHGSDSPASAVREIEIISNLLRRKIAALQGQQN